jgi:hypothetical protein
MKNIEIKKLVMRYAIISVVASVVVSNLVIGGFGIARAANEDGELTISGSAKAIASLYKELAAEIGFGAQTAVWDDEVISTYNSFCLTTDEDNNSSYQNCTREFVGLSMTNATDTILSVKNTWGQTVFACDQNFFFMGTASTTLFAYAGTSTVSSIPLGTVAANIPQSLFSPEYAYSPTSGAVDVFVSSVAATGTRYIPSGAGSCIPVREGEYYVANVRATSDSVAATSTADVGLSEIIASVTFKTMSTSTQTW